MPAPTNKDAQRRAAEKAAARAAAAADRRNIPPLPYLLPNPLPQRSYATPYTPATSGVMFNPNRQLDTSQIEDVRNRPLYGPTVTDTPYGSVYGVASQRPVQGPPAPKPAMFPLDPKKRGPVTAKTVFQQPRANEFSTTNPITRSLTASTYGAQQPAPPLTHSQRAARLRSEAQTHLYSGNPEKAAQTIVEALGAGYGFTDNQQNPNINGYGEYRPTSPTVPYGAMAGEAARNGMAQVAPPPVDPLTAYRSQVAAQAQALDAGRSTPWLRAAEPLPGNLPSEPRTASEFVNALTPAQLASPEVQDLLKTLLGEDPQPWGSWYNGYQR